MKKLDLNRKEDFFVKATVVVNNREIIDIPCKIYLPERITERPYIVLKPEKEIILNWKVKFNPINYDKTASIKTIIELDDVYISNSNTNYWGSELIENTICGEPKNLRIIDKIKSEKSGKTNITFWISNNKFLSPFISSETSYTGSVQYTRIRNFEFIINNGIRLFFDKHFQSKFNDNDELIQWSNLVVCTELDTPATDIADDILSIIDDFLLIASFASRQRTACLGWTANDENSDVTFYRCDIILPKNNEEHNLDDGVIDIKNYESFVNMCYTNFLSFDNKLAIRNAIYAVFPSKNLELSFLHLFSGLESLVLDFRRRKNFEYILPKKKFSILRKSIKNFIEEESVNQSLGEDEITSISNKLSELNRVSLKEAFEYFCKEYKLDISDLWCVFKNREGIGLSDIRNKLIHGDPFPSELFTPLMVANENLRFILERVVIVVFGQNINETNLRADYLRNFTAISDLNISRKKISEYISQSNSI